MKIALAHNFYRVRGGEDEVVERECALLESAGHHVFRFFRNSQDTLGNAGWREKARTAQALSFSPDSYRDFSVFLQKHKPDIVHAHNTFPLLSPSIFYAARALGIPAVATLHNFRFLCANGLFLRDNHPCEKCLSGSPAWGTWHACYRESRLATLPLTLLIQRYKKGRGLAELVDRLLVLSDFSREKFLEAGVAPEKIVVRPNFCEDPGPPPDWATRENAALYVGRLSPEKGILPLLEAWKKMTIPLIVVGHGPQAEEAKKLATPQVKFLGPQPPQEVRRLMRSTKLLVVPSLAYENFPLVVAEAWASGLPIAAHRHGSLQSLLSHRENGFLFPSLRPLSMAEEWRKLWEDQTLLARMGQKGREHYLKGFTPKAGLSSLESIYASALKKGERKSDLP